MILSDAEIKEAITPFYKDAKVVRMAIEVSLDEYRAIEAATVAKLSQGVSVEPDVMTYDHGDHRLPLYSHSPKQLYIAIAAARLQAIGDCRDVVGELSYDVSRDECVEAIRALIGGVK